MSKWRQLVVILCFPAIIPAWWFGYVVMWVWISFRSGMLVAKDDSVKQYTDRLNKGEVKE